MPNVPNQPDAPQRAELERKAPSVPVSLEERVERLEQLVAGMAAEVRTRRLVVVDDRDVERITAQCMPEHDRQAELRVMSPHDPESWVSMSSDAGMEGGAPQVRLDLSIAGSIHAGLQASPAGSGEWDEPDGVVWGDTHSELMVGGAVQIAGYSTPGGLPRKAGD